jgi:hypothetical protein
MPTILIVDDLAADREFLGTLLRAGRIRLGEHGEARRGLGISMDVTARRTLELQYQQAQKMEAIGRPSASRTTSTTCSRRSSAAAACCSPISRRATRAGPTSGRSSRRV